MKRHFNGVCPECGESDFSLGVDYTRYYRVTWDGDKFVTEFDHEEESCEPARFFCIRCGEYLEVPEELE